MIKEEDDQSNLKKSCLSLENDMKLIKVKLKRKRRKAFKSNKKGYYIYFFINIYILQISKKTIQS